ncbi:stress-response A/B barrel domain-containing protein HS1-like [Benincasa hispida]|uniref:stress-response A/B barrel domain-containing protein HS1-like n=1 Tax=Benincasa hispida TaxID=102211 RepID=UPI0018FF29A0|nr:stress-response A/B barrel domain-containing protein HS1-like [Benincasa hispida]
MGESKGMVIHILLAKFKDEITEEQIEELKKAYANLVNLIEPMKTFQWGKNVSIENLHEGYTHVFQSTFESKQGMVEYIEHPAHAKFSDMFLPSLEKIIVVDYEPTVINFDEPTLINSDEPKSKDSDESKSKDSDEPKAKDSDALKSKNSDEPKLTNSNGSN